MKELEARETEGQENDAAASETSTVPAGGPEAMGGDAAEIAAAAEETVPRGEYNKLKAERDQLLDRVARLQAEFENARKRAERQTCTRIVVDQRGQQHAGDHGELERSGDEPCRRVTRGPCEAHAEQRKADAAPD